MKTEMLMQIYSRTCLIFVACSLCACGAPNRQYDYAKDHIEIAKQLKVPLQLEAEFGKGYHFITGYPAQKNQIWRSNFYIFGKYKLGLEIRLLHDPVKNTWTPSAPILIQINEILDIRLNSHGQAETNYGAQWQFGVKEWEDIMKNGLKQLVKTRNSDGKFEELVKGKPVKNFGDYVHGWTKDLIPLELPKIEQEEKSKTRSGIEAEEKNK